MPNFFLIPSTIPAPAASKTYAIKRGTKFPMNQFIMVIESDMPVILVPRIAATINRKIIGNKPTSVINFPTPPWDYSRYHTYNE